MTVSLVLLPLMASKATPLSISTCCLMLRVPTARRNFKCWVSTCKLIRLESVSHSLLLRENSAPELVSIKYPLFDYRGREGGEEEEQQTDYHASLFT